MLTQTVHRKSETRPSPGQFRPESGAPTISVTMATKVARDGLRSHDVGGEALRPHPRLGAAASGGRPKTRPGCPSTTGQAAGRRYTTLSESVQATVSPKPYSDTYSNSHSYTYSDSQQSQSQSLSQEQSRNTTSSRMAAVPSRAPVSAPGRGQRVAGVQVGVPEWRHGFQQAVKKRRRGSRNEGPGASSWGGAAGAGRLQCRRTSGTARAQGGDREAAGGACP